MSSVDDRIVNMQFNNKQFQSGAAESTKSLQDLEKTIGGMGKGGSGLDAMGKSVEGITGKLSAMQITGVTAIATLANKAVNAGLTLAKSFTFGPLVDGFHEYEKILTSTQVITANTQRSTADVGKALNSLNHYSDETIYNFGQMADAIGRFTAAGVKLEPAVTAIKGMANSAALSGASVEDLNRAMYQTSQALSTGVIKLQDWKSLENANLGGARMQESLRATAKTLGDHGKAMEAAIKKNGSFRASLSEGWLSSQVFTKAMKVMAGQSHHFGKTTAFTVKQLRGMGYAKDAAIAMNKLSASAIESATKVKTFSQLIGVVKESIGSGWSQIFRDLFGNLDEASKLWTGVSDTITDAVNAIFKSMDKMLVSWRKADGFTNLWKGFGNIFKTLSNIITPFVTAFRSVFPEADKAGSKLGAATKAFADFTGWLVKMTDHTTALTPILVTFFSLFKRIGDLGAAVVSGIAPVVPIIGDLVSKLQDLIELKFGGFIEKASSIGQAIVDGIQNGINGDSIKMAVEKFATSIVDWIKNVLGIHSPAAALVPVGEAIVMGIAEGILNAIQFVLGAMVTVGQAVAQGFKDMFSGLDAVDWVSILNLGVLGALALTIKRFMDRTNGFVGLGKKISDAFDQLKGTLKSMQTEIKAAIILQIAIAVGILTASLIALSFVDPKKLATGIFALAQVMAMLMLSVKTLATIKPTEMVRVSSTLLALSAAVAILSASIALLAAINPDKLSQGLTAIAAGMGLLVASLVAISDLTTGAGLAEAAGAIIVLAQAMAILTASIVVLGQMNPDKLSQGMTAVAAGMGIFIAALVSLNKLVNPKGLAKSAAAVIVLAQAMAIMAGAVVLMGLIDGEQLAHGMTAMAVGLALMVGSLALLSKIGPGVAGSAAAIITMAQAMAIMAGALLVLGAQKGGDLAKGLVAVAAALLIFIGAAYLAANPVVVTGLTALGLAAFSLGAGLALAGAGMLAAATAIGILAVVGSAGIGVLAAAFTTLMALLPAFAIQVGTAVVLFIETIASMAPRLRVAFGTIFENMLGVIQDAIPHILDLVDELVKGLLGSLEKAIPEVQRVVQAYIDAFIETLKDSTNDIVNAGLDIIDNFLTSLGKHIKSIITAGKNIIIAVIEGLGSAAVEIANAAGETIVKFIDGLSDAIDTYAGPIRTAAIKLAWALVDGMTGGLLDFGIRKVKEAITALLQHIPQWAQDLLGIASPSKMSRYWGEMIVAGFVKGITDNIKYAVGATVALANAVIAAGDKSIAKAQKNASKKQIAFEKAAARAKVSDRLATKAERVADANPNNRALQAAAKQARKIADQQAKIADKAQKAAEAAAQHVEDVKTFQAADSQERGQIFADRAKQLSDRAIAALALANAEAIAAKKLRGKERDAMLKQAREDAKAAKALADRSKAANDKANLYFAKSVNERIKQIEDEKKARDQAAAEQKQFDEATPAEQVDLLKAKADAAQKRSEAAFKESEALVQQAKKLAKTDAKKAQKLLDQAEALSEEAQKAADDAQQFSDQAAQIEGSSSGGNFQLSQSAMEDAAKAIDRYTDSLRQAEDAAAAVTPIYQFVQNNNSPEALSEIDLYRQTNNLLSLAETKMAVPSTGP